MVDDEKEICDIFARILGKKGHSVTVAPDGKTAIGLCRDRQFDLIYLDIVMPEMDGIATFNQIMNVMPGAKIIFMTGKIIGEEVVKMLSDKGAIGLIQKPINFAEVLLSLQNPG